MVDRVANDHPSVETVRATVRRHGGARRRLELPADAAEEFVIDGVVETIIDEKLRFGRYRPIRGSIALTGLYNTQMAATGETDGEELLTSWLDLHDRSIGSSILVDIVVPEERVGLRLPGDRTTYEVVRRRDSALDAIAEKYLEDSG